MYRTEIAFLVARYCISGYGVGIDTNDLRRF